MKRLVIFGLSLIGAVAPAFSFADIMKPVSCQAGDNLTVSLMANRRFFTVSEGGGRPGVYQIIGIKQTDDGAVYKGIRRVSYTQVITATLRFDGAGGEISWPNGAELELENCR